MKIAPVKTVAAYFGKRRVQHLLQPETGAAQGALTRHGAAGYIVWEEPNRAKTPELQIGRSGGRYSTLTGVWWLDEERFIVAHRSGLKMAVFSTDRPVEPLWSADIDHVSDDIAAKQIAPSTWEIAISGCWDCMYSRHRLNAANGSFDIEKLEQLDHTSKDFSHGVAYDRDGNLCFSIHTGKHPRFNIGGAWNKLPAPWGVRDLCHDPARKRHLAIAVSANPRRKAYGGVQTTIWSCAEGSSVWECLALYDNVHSDSLDVWNDHIWIPDQVRNRLIAVDAATGAVDSIFSGDALDFPHGLGISNNGIVAVTNYGTSSVALAKANDLLQQAGSAISP